ncbi:MAG: diguanylate cyclase [Acetivibrio sp.]
MMIDNSLSLVFIAFLALLFYLYTHLTLTLTDGILERKMEQKTVHILTEIELVIILGLFSFFPQASSFWFYLGFGGLLFLEFLAIYKMDLIGSFFCSSFVMIHLMSIRSIGIALVSFASRFSIYETTSKLKPSLYAMAISFLLLDWITFILLKKGLNKEIKIISRKNTQEVFLVSWMTLFNAYLLYNSEVYRIPIEQPGLVSNQIITPIVILAGFYIVLFFAIKTATLLGYKNRAEELQLIISSEQQYRESMMKDSLKSYEFNLNRNLILKGVEEYREQFGDRANDYTDMLIMVVKKMVHPEDIKDMIKKSMPIAMLNDFKNGKTETITEYRRLMPSGEYIWVSSVTNLVKDFQTGDVKGFTYIKDINEEKRKQIELQNMAERDSLTGLYNKGTTALMIRKFLREEKVSNGALFIVDVDNFKSVNDHFGHTYGDIVLCELAKTLNNLFLQDGMVGRIGGDECIAFMKNPKDIQAVKDRGEKMCHGFYTTYKGEHDLECTVSCSIGIALFPQDGETFEELYKNADATLYAVKSAGKNSFRLYDGKAFCGYESHRTEIENNDKSI